MTSGAMPTGAIRAAGIILCLIALSSCDNDFSTDNNGKYLTTKVVRESISDEVIAAGTLQAFEQVDVGSQVSGQLKKLSIKVGDIVHQGQLLAEIDPVLLQNSLKAAQATSQRLVAERKAQIARRNLAAFKLQSQAQMLPEGSTARQTYEEARAQLEIELANLAVLDAQIQEAQINVETAQANLAFTRITAPIDGTVVAIVTQQGQTVIAEQEAPVILKLANLRTMTVRAQISEADIDRVRTGQSVYFTTLGDSDTRHRAILRAIEPAPQNFFDAKNSGDSPRAASAVFYPAVLDVENSGRNLRIGETAQVHILLAMAEEALTVPLAALKSHGARGTASVRVLDNDGGAVERNVHVGISNEMSIQVLDGLKEGEEVILDESQADTDE